MARTVADKPITTRASRAKLPASPNAHFRRLTDRMSVGYRKGTKLPGLWTVRLTGEDGKTQQRRIAGVADDLEKANGNDVLSYDQACAAARDVFAPTPTTVTVSRALDLWLANKLAAGMRERAERSTTNWVVRTQKLFGDKKVLDLSVADIEAYRDGFLLGYPEDRLRARRATANRDLASLKAALSFAADRHFPDAPRPWDKVRKFGKAEAFAKRVVVLDPEQEERLLACCETREAANLWRAGLYTGARYGELVAANVGDYTPRRLRLSGKTGPRTMVLSPTADEFFCDLVAGVNDAERPLLADEDGNRWHHDKSRGPIDRSIAAADLPDGTTYYAARHTYATRYLSRGVPPMAVAQQMGTSIQMLENTYSNWLGTDLEAWFGD